MSWLQVAALIVACAWAGTASAREVAGFARAIDGDSLLVNGVEHRLFGIDAMEYEQTCLDRQQRRWACGHYALQALERLLQGQIVVCAVASRDRFGRPLATCWNQQTEINRKMVELGQALAYRRYSSRYIVPEAQARQQQLGIWQGSFVNPWDYRQQKPTVRHDGLPGTSGAAGTTRSGASSTLNARQIKGNINRQGRRIYHCPGDRSYAKTRINSAAGERWFKTPAEAEAAGWVRPRRGGRCSLK